MFNVFSPIRRLLRPRHSIFVLSHRAPCPCQSESPIVAMTTHVVVAALQCATKENIRGVGVKQQVPIVKLQENLPNSLEQWAEQNSLTAHWIGQHRVRRANVPR